MTEAAIILKLCVALCLGVLATFLALINFPWLGVIVFVVAIYFIIELLAYHHDI